MIAQFDAVDKFLTAMGIDSSKLTTIEVSTLRYVMLKAIESESNLVVSDFMYNNDYLGQHLRSETRSTFKIRDRG